MYDLIKKQIAAEYFTQRFSNDGQRFVAWYLCVFQPIVNAVSV